MLSYVICCGLAFAFLGIVWKTSDLLNILLKLLWLALAAWSFANFLKAF